MSRQPFTTRLGQAFVSATIGAICGGLLASFGSVVSSSTIMIGATIVGGTLLGGWLGRFWGAVNGAIIGGMLTSFGSLVGGSPMGVVCTISACALLGGWLRWRSQERKDGVPPQSLPSTLQERRNPVLAYCAAGTDARLSLAAAVEVDDLWLRWDGFQTSRMIL